MCNTTDYISSNTNNNYHYRLFISIAIPTMATYVPIGKMVPIPLSLSTKTLKSVYYKIGTYY